MWQAIILICAIGLDVYDCNTETAVHVVNGPHALSIEHCLMVGTQYIAGSGLVDGPVYVKVRCDRGEAA